MRGRGRGAAVLLAVLALPAAVDGQEGSQATRDAAGTGRRAVPGSALRQGGPRGGLSVGVEAGLNWFPNWVDVVADQPDLQSADGRDAAVGAGVFAEWVPAGRPNAVLGLSLNYNRQTFEQRYDSADPLQPVTADGTVNAWFIDGYGGFVIPFRRTVIHTTLGGTIATDCADLRFDYGGVIESARRSNTGFMANVGGGVDFPLSDRFDARVSARYTTALSGGSADDHARFGVGLKWKF